MYIIFCVSPPPSHMLFFTAAGVLGCCVRVLRLLKMPRHAAPVGACPGEDLITTLISLLASPAIHSCFMLFFLSVLPLSKMQTATLQTTGLLANTCTSQRQGLGGCLPHAYQGHGTPRGCGGTFKHV